MTWSIAARDPESGALGVAVSSRFFAVGAVCPHVRSGVGAFSSQALCNPYLGIGALARVEAGDSAEAAIAAVVAEDAARAERQIHGVDSLGRAAAFTGERCDGWAGQRTATDVSVAGNMLTGPDVVEATFGTWRAHERVPFAERLLRALHAGEAAGGDKRGRQAAALVVCTTEAYPALDIRVDDHPQPIAELWRLYEVAHERHLAFRACMPTKANPSGVATRALLNERIDATLEAQGPVDFSAFWKPQHEGGG